MPASSHFQQRQVLQEQGSQLAWHGIDPPFRDYGWSSLSPQPISQTRKLSTAIVHLRPGRTVPSRDSLQLTKFPGPGDGKRHAQVYLVIPQSTIPSRSNRRADRRPAPLLLRSRLFVRAIWDRWNRWKQSEPHLFIRPDSVSSRAKQHPCILS